MHDDAPPWKEYLAALCRDAWRLDTGRASEVQAGIESLLTAGDLTDDAVASVLRRAGVTESSAAVIAPTIRAAIFA